MNGEPDYKQMYHLMREKRDEELRLIKKLGLDVAALMHLYESIDRRVAEKIAEFTEDREG